MSDVKSASDQGANSPGGTAGEMPIRVQRMRAKGWRMPPNTVYVGRPTLYGNDVKIGDKPGCGDMSNCHCEAPCKGMTAEECVQLYRDTTAEWLTDEILAFLRGKNLACYCPLDQPCHADVLLELANRKAA
jgi:hypothetical protein